MTEGTSKTLQVTGRHQPHPNYTWPCLMLLRGNAFQSQPEMQLCRWMGAVCSTTRPCHHSLRTQRAALRSWPTGSLRVPWPDWMWRRPFLFPDGASCDRNLCQRHAGCRAPPQNLMPGSVLHTGMRKLNALSWATFWFRAK